MADLVDLVSYQPGSKLFIATPNNADTNFIIKGFVSVQIPDRSKDLVNPAAFDIASYMAQPAVLVNHALWSNKDGNRVGVGVPLSVAEVKLKSCDEPGMWCVWDVHAKKEIDRFPKERNPNLGVHTRGLYAFIRITDPDVINMVKSGELSGFSWRGMSRPEYVYDNKTASTYKSYSHIDLVEISLVTAPNNPGSSFIVAKDAVHSYRFSKGKFSLQDVANQLKMDHSEGFAVVQDEQTIYAYDKTRELDEDGLLVVKMADGADLILGKPTRSSAMLTLPEDEKETFLKAVATQKETSMPADTPVTAVVPTQPAEVVENSTPPATTQTPTSPTGTPVLDVEGLVSKATEAIMGKIAPVFETLTKQVQVLAQTQQDMIAKMTTPAVVETPPTAPTTVTTPVDPMAEVTKKLNEFAGIAEQVQKSLANITPAQLPRTEPTKPKKEADKSPNSVFNGLFGI